METEVGSGEILTAREISIREFNSLRGRLCTVIEAAGMRKPQERALVTLIKNLSYQNQAVIAELIDKLDQSDDEGNPIMFRYTENKLES